MCDREKAPLDSNVTGAPNLFNSPLSATPSAEKKVNTTTNMKENEYNDKNAIFAGETQVFVVVLLEFYVHVDVKILLKTKIGSNP